MIYALYLDNVDILFQMHLLDNNMQCRVYLSLIHDGGP